ncbi:MAG: tetratricopeptide repeat protein [Hyphomonadaceae bacterium]|nr:tetratricopeptide repeat protein [Hyphomonadaceae bacterium]
MKTGDTAPFVNAARELLDKNDPAGAEQLLAPLLHRLRTNAPALHLMGLIKKARGANAEAERYFRAAIANALSEGNYYNDLGVMLQQRGAHDEAVRIFRAAQALLPHVAIVRVNLVRALMAVERWDEAEREARALAAAMPGPEGWSLLAQVQRGQERHEDALASFEKALERAPNARGLQHNYASALERVGRGAEALQRYEKLAKGGLDTPELALGYARALYAAGRLQDAEGVLESALTPWSDNVALHATLARMRALRGEGDASALLMEAQLERTPGDLALRLACADVLHRAGEHARALDILAPGLAQAPDLPGLLTAQGFLLDEMGRLEEALAVLRRAAEIAADETTARRNLLSTLLRAGRAQEALSAARELRKVRGEDQYLIAIEMTALRMLGDPLYRAACDYERLTRVYTLETPRGHFSAESFHAALAEALRRQHAAHAHPLDQQAANVSQTPRTLLAVDDPALRAFLGAAEPAVRDYIARLKGDDIITQRKTQRYRFAALSSTRLSDGGAVPNHVRDDGWISGVFVAALAAGERPSDPRAGWLKLGEPNRALDAVEKWVEPKVGALVLFPAYFWRGIAPFEGRERLSLAFDVIPA